MMLRLVSVLAATLLVWNLAAADVLAAGTYKGGFKNGKRHGLGVYVWTNGDRYQGDFRDGKFSGRGVWIGANGDRYEGDFRNDSFSGRGIFFLANGSECRGQWHDGKLLRLGEAYKNGEHQFCYAKGRIIKFKKSIPKHILCNKKPVNCLSL